MACISITTKGKEVKIVMNGKECIISNPNSKGEEFTVSVHDNFEDYTCFTQANPLNRQYPYPYSYPTIPYGLFPQRNDPIEK